MAQGCACANPLFLDKFLTCPTGVGDPTGPSVGDYGFLYQGVHIGAGNRGDTHAYLATKGGALLLGVGIYCINLNF